MNPKHPAGRPMTRSDEFVDGREAPDGHAFKRTDRRSASACQGKCPISPSITVRTARGAGSRLHLAPVLQQGRKSAKIYGRSAVIGGIPVDASSGVIWGMSAKTFAPEGLRYSPCLPVMIIRLLP